MNRMVVAGALLVNCMVFTGSALAENQTAQEGRFFVNPMVGGVHMESSRYDPEVNYSLGLGYNHSANLSSEILGSYAREKSGPDGEAYALSIGALYHFMPEERLVPYLAVGLGLLGIDPPNENKSHHSQFNYGAGLKYFLNEDIALNSEVRHLLASSGEPNNLMYSVGLVYSFGGKGKPAPAPTLAPPPVDSDADGVIDSLDKCPGTPIGVAVDRDGCPLDSDGDGVFDYLDKCPGTPFSVAVDRDGCPLDSDGDGVLDYLDKCPGTPMGVAVDRDGCPLPVDSDGDGVIDSLDRCPDTPAGALVDEHGCQLSLTLLIQFATNRAEVRPHYVDDMANAAAFINKYPAAQILISGHTDSDGSAEYNQRLSQQRADAVKAYLIEKYGIDGTRLMARGFGEGQPLADNTTAAGKQRNRRVEINLFKK